MVWFLINVHTDDEAVDCISWTLFQHREEILLRFEGWKPEAVMLYKAPWRDCIYKIGIYK